MISNFYNSELINSEKQCDGVKRKLGKPLTLIEYNQCMKGVFFFTKEFSTIPIIIIFKSSGSKIIFLLEIVIFNSFVVYKEIRSVRRVNHLECKDDRLALFGC